MNVQLEESYFTWLYGQVGSITNKNRSKSYWALLLQMHHKEFVWIVPNDDNRVDDGKALRHEFVESEGISGVDRDWFEMGCSMLELLIGLSRRLEFETDIPAHTWFYQLLQNLGLDQFNDRVGVPAREVDDILERVIWRTYDADGQGGLFPLKGRHRNQRDVELWYQMSAYILEE